MDSAEVNNVKRRFEISQHTFINRLATGLAKAITNEVPQLTPMITGRSNKPSEISLVVIANAELKDEKEKSEVQESVRGLVDELKNPVTGLLPLLDK